MSSKEPPVSISLALGSQTHTAMPGFLCGWCRWLSGPHSWELYQLNCVPSFSIYRLAFLCSLPLFTSVINNSCLLTHPALGVLRSQGGGHKSSFCEPRVFLTTNSHQRSSLGKSQELMQSALVSPLWLSAAFLGFVLYRQHGQSWLHTNVPLGCSHHTAVLRMLPYALGYFFPHRLHKL